MQELVAQIKNLISDNKNQIDFKEQKRKYQISSSIHLLSIVPDIINEYKIENFTLINIYGLLQVLFVSIDALYDLAYAITNNKWSININNNPKLRDIKFIRNDVVGHPTSRQYNDSIGFCYMDIEKTNKNYLVYDCFLTTEEEIIHKQIDICDMLDNFINESLITLKEILIFINKKNKIINMLYPLAKQLYEEFNHEGLNNKLLNQLRNSYIEIYQLEIDSKNRFLWRLDIIKELNSLNIKNNKEKNIISYLIKKQLKKILLMANESDIKQYNITNDPSKIVVHDPAIIEITKKYLKNNKYKEIIKDPNHPLFNQVIDKLIVKAPDGAKEILLMLKKYANNQTLVYALASSL